jgi:hypothetical protein
MITCNLESVETSELIDQIMRSYGAYIRFADDKWGILTDQSASDIRGNIYRLLPNQRHVTIAEPDSLMLNEEDNISNKFFRRYI